MRLFSTTGRFVTSTILALVAAGSMAVDARAAFSLRLADADTEITIDDDAATDFDGAEGGILWAGTLGQSSLVIGAATSMPLLGSADTPMMHLTGSVRTVNPSGGTYTISLTQTGFTGTQMGLDPAAFLSVIGGAAGGNVVMETWVDVANNPFGKGTLLSTLSGPDIHGLLAGVDGSDNLSLSSLFSLTMIITVTHGSPVAPSTAVVSSFDATLEALPEPGMSTMWLGIGACVSGGAALRRWRHGAAV